MKLEQRKNMIVYYKNPDQTSDLEWFKNDKVPYVCGVLNKIE